MEAFAQKRMAYVKTFKKQRPIPRLFWRLRYLRVFHVTGYISPFFVVCSFLLIPFFWEDGFWEGGGSLRFQHAACVLVLQQIFFFFLAAYKQTIDISSEKLDPPKKLGFQTVFEEKIHPNRWNTVWIIIFSGRKIPTGGSFFCGPFGSLWFVGMLHGGSSWWLLRKESRFFYFALGNPWFFWIGILIYHALWNNPYITGA